MRKFLITAAALASTIAIAAPAAAQWQQPYGNAYGYQNNRGVARSYAVRLNQLHRAIHQLGERRQLSRGEFLRLNREVDIIQERLRRASYRGLDRREAFQIERELARLEHNIYREARDGGRYGDHHSRSQYGNDQFGTDYRYDRDRDGRDDRYEDDRGRDFDSFKEARKHKKDKRDHDRDHDRDDD